MCTGNSRAAHYFCIFPTATLHCILPVYKTKTWSARYAGKISSIFVVMNFCLILFLFKCRDWRIISCDIAAKCQSLWCLFFFFKIFSFFRWILWCLFVIDSLSGCCLRYGARRSPYDHRRVRTRRSWAVRRTQTGAVRQEFAQVHPKRQLYRYDFSYFQSIEIYLKKQKN